MSQTGHRLGDVLRAAREQKGLDLTRAERETKIRSRYLSALELGEYRDLPGAVYVKGFLRNYGHYLGLDPEYLIDLYRLESGAGQPDRSVSLPRTTTARAPAFVVTPGAVAALVLTLLVGGFVAYLGYEFVTFAGTPTLTITDPARDLARYSRTEYTLRGTTAPNSRVTVTGGLRENPETIADAAGRFEIVIKLVPGPNLLRVKASDPKTGRDTNEEQRTIHVTTAVAEEPEEKTTLSVAEPGPSVTVSGPAVVSGATNAPRVVITPTLVQATPPAFTVSSSTGEPVQSPAATPAQPAPLELTAQDGAFRGTLPLPPGVWDLAITATPRDGDPVEETRRVTVAAPAGLAVRLEVRGGPSYLEAYEDDVADDAVSFRNASAGANIDLSAQRTIRIRAGSAGAVTVSVNGVRLGPMGAMGAVVEWTITRSG